MTWETVAIVGTILLIVMVAGLIFGAIISAFLDAANKRSIERYKAGLPVASGGYDYRRAPKND